MVVARSLDFSESPATFEEGGSTLSNTKGVCCTGVAAPQGGSTDILSAGALEGSFQNTQVNSPPHEAGRRMHEVQ